MSQQAEQESAPAAEAQPEQEQKPVTIPQKAPEQYADFKLPNGTTASSASISAFSDVARELNLTQEQAQKMFEAVMPQANKYGQELARNNASQWAEAAQNDQEIGGVSFQKNLATAQQAYNKFATPELKSILDATGLGSHPEFVRLFYRIGQSIAQDTGVSGTGTPEAPRRMFPNSQMVV